jgi:hypothetical protein
VLVEMKPLNIVRGNFMTSFEGPLISKPGNRFVAKAGTELDAFRDLTAHNNRLTGILQTHPIRSSRRMIPPPTSPIGDWRRGSGEV